MKRYDKFKATKGNNNLRTVRGRFKVRGEEYNAFIDALTEELNDLSGSIGSGTFIGLTDTTLPSVGNGYLRWDAGGNTIVYETSIPSTNITGLAAVATSGDYGDLINKVSVAPGSANYLSINASNELSVSNLLVTGVTVDDAADLTAFIGDFYTAGTEFQEGDLIILSTPSEVWVHNGGTGAPFADHFTSVEVPQLTDAYIRNLLSTAVGTPLSYNPTTGEFTISQANATTDGYLTSGDWSTFNAKPETLADQGDVTITTGAQGDILYRNATEWVNLPAGTNGQFLKTGGAGANPSWDDATVSVDAFGIANTSGVYTYYSSFQAAITAASAGETVEMFADITETTDTTVTLKAGVKINGNGHTYTLDFASATDALTINTPNAIYWLNSINVNRVNSTSGTALRASANDVSIYGKDTYFESDDSFATVYLQANDAYIENVTIKNTGTGRGLYMFASSSKAFNCISSSITLNAIQGGNSTLCIGESTNAGGISGGVITKCYGRSGASSYGVYGQTEVSNCVGYSQTGNGIAGGQLAKYYNSKGESFSGVGIRLEIGTAHNCTAISGGSYGMAAFIGACNISNCTIISSGNYGLYLANNGIYTGGTYVKNCYIESKLNSVNGHALVFINSSTATTVNPEVSNNNFKTLNAGANGMFHSNTGAIPTRNINYANNTFAGMTTTVNTGILQGTTNTSDSQGNILL